MSTNQIKDAEALRIRGLESSVEAEQRWIEFMKANGYPEAGAKMTDSLTRLSTRVRLLDEALAKTST